MMKVYKLTIFSTLALSACLPRAAVENEAVAAISQGDSVNAVGSDVVVNNSTVAGEANAVEQGENQDDQADDEKNAIKDGKENIDQILNGNLENGLQDINIDPNDILGSLGQNILDLMLAMGICNFNLNNLQGLGLGNQIQLLLQLQQLQQLQALGIVNPLAVRQLLQQGILSRTFNLNIIKRSIGASVQQASRGMKRTTLLKRQCANVGQPQDNANDQADQNQNEEGENNKDQAEQDQENEGEAEGEEEADVEEEKENVEQDNEEGIEVP